MWWSLNQTPSGRLRDRRLDDLSYERLRALEKELGIWVHRRLFDEIQGALRYRDGRLLQWLSFFWILLVFGLNILLIRLSTYTIFRNNKLNLGFRNF